MTWVYWRKVTSQAFARLDFGKVVAEWEMDPPRVGDQVMLGHLEHGLHKVVEVTWTSSKTLVAWVVEIG